MKLKSISKHNIIAFQCNLRNVVTFEMSFHNSIKGSKKRFALLATFRFIKYQ